MRERAHALEYAALLGHGPCIDVADLPPAVRLGSGEAGGPSAGDSEAAGSLKRELAQPERKLILEALERHNWRRDAAARALGINRTSLYKKLKRLGIRLADLQPAR